MRSKNFTVLGIIILILTTITTVQAQVEDGVYICEVDGMRHELRMADGYFIHSEYRTKPAEFVKTVGGYYTFDNGILNVELEFNSNHADNGMKKLSIPVVIEEGKLILPIENRMAFTKSDVLKQDLDGTWLFARCGDSDNGERRDDSNPRKTLKQLKDGRFQWIAYNTDTMEFFGTGGGAFTSTDGKYVENIEYFSRDDSRVGATLDFQYQIKNGDWHHRGKNSKGEAMYEIWARR